MQPKRKKGGKKKTGKKEFADIPKAGLLHGD